MKSENNIENDMLLFDNEQIHEILVQELFRQLIIKNNIANDYHIVFLDNFELKKDEYAPFYDKVNIFKDANNIWNVWEDVEYEVFMGHFM